MSSLDLFLWVVFPYICLTVFVLGHIYRYNTDQFGWSAKSSQFLEKKKLKWGSILFHWGIIFVFFGHVAGVLIPKIIYDSIGVTDHMYHFGAVWFGGAAGVICVLGGALLFMRRASVKRIRVNSKFKDWLSLVLLGIVVIVGFTNTVGYTASGGDFDYRTTIGPWFRGILTFNPAPGYMIGAPIGFQAHILLAFALFAVWPFTRLVHVWSLPLEYLKRKYLVYRRMTPAKNVTKRN
ncbi:MULTISPECIES: respiratory nitrate reductase subunit gamma [unclassified Mesobacillus]|uniref:respiratory nitrate reductase subunit gamma n=1 Tax=unclassified Mesobacillus TaxID=2675270 RepID=UPI00203EE1DF|nr:MULTISPECIES: respiratory nitrate reductase subunit gamma [unclassified Mesobacillus]MCM3124997.1 respiratory nitrate reductase subunit gamma [Mesobacillus sp. MER 33]MCM3235243.1 respiratory nitrate reductase subunit gamma [Mesobacillus sp. MER 48]